MYKNVMCVGTWPENGYKDFVVIQRNATESDESLLEIARQHYGDDNEYYIVESEYMLTLK